MMEQSNRRAMKTRHPVAELHAQTGEERESNLHQSILDYCRSQWPRWKVIHCRMDKRSTIETGVHDITAFMPGQRTLCIECKAKGKKLTEDQLAWKTEMQRLGHTVHTVYNFNQFLAAIEANKKESH